MQSPSTSKFLKAAGLLAIAGLIGWALFARIFHNTSGKEERTGHTGVDGIRVPEGFTVERVAGSDQVVYPMLAVLDDRGRLFVTESSGKNISGQEMAKHPECRVRLLEDLNKDGIYEHSKVFADRLSLPMGALWYRGSLYVASPPRFRPFG